MTSKKKRRRHPPARREAASRPASEAAGRTGKAPGPRSDRVGQRPARDQRGSLILQPPLLPSLGRGVLTVGRSPALLATAFLGLGVMWMLSTIPVDLQISSPGALSQLLALAPVHSLADANLLNLSTRVLNPVLVVGLAALVLVVRAMLTVFWVSTSKEMLQGNEDWRTAARRSLLSLSRVRTVLAVEVLFLAIVFVLPSILAGVLGILGLVASILLPMYFLAYAPVVAVAEETGFQQTLRFALRAARARGPQHTLLSFAYSFSALLSLFYGLSDIASPATPSFPTWLYGLGFTALHVAVLATFVDRWLSLREQVMAAPTRQPSQGFSARAGRRG